MFLTLFLSNLAFSYTEKVPQAKLLEEGAYQEGTRINTTGTTDGIIVERTAFNNIQDESLDGGAIYIVKGGRVDCYINNCKFNTCKGKNGGAVYIDYATTTNNCTIFATTFNNCEAKANGGALYIKNTQGSKKPEYFVFIECTFTSNSASQGGAIYGIIRDQLTIQSCTFDNNVAKTGSSLYFSFGLSNNATGNDTLIFYDNTFKFTPSENNLINVYIETMDHKKQYPPISNVYFGGSTFSVNGSPSGDYKHLKIVENTPGFKSFNFDRCNCVQQESSTVSIPETFNSLLYNFTFNCQSLDSCTPSNPVVKPTTPAPVDPPAGEYVTTHDRVVPTKALTIRRTIFSQIQNPTLNGSAIFISTGSRYDCFIDDCKFESCSSLAGGAIFASYASKAYNFTIYDSLFNECEASDIGGALYLKNSQYTNKEYITLLKCKLISNKASKGGAIFGEIRHLLSITSCTFENNEATIGSSFFCIFGQDKVINSGEDDTLVISDTSFLFQPSENNKINVHIETKPIENLAEDGPCTNLYMGGCTFSINGNSLIDGTKNLELIENDGGFNAINFDKCNCVKEAESTFTIPSKFAPITNTQFGCNSIDTCTPEVLPPTNSDVPVVPPTNPGVPVIPQITRSKLRSNNR